MEILEILVRFFRRLILKLLPKSISKHIDPDSILGDAIGLVGGVATIILCVYLFTLVAHEISIDRCLDSGRKWDYEVEKCIN